MTRESVARSLSDCKLISDSQSIMQTLLPFYAFDHAELEKRNLEAEKTVETFTMIVKKGKVEIQVGLRGAAAQMCGD